MYRDRASSENRRSGWWQYVDVHRCQLGTFGATEISYVMADGPRQAAQQAEGLDELFQQLKAAAYRPGEGTWFVYQLGYYPRGKSYNALEHIFALEWPFASAFTMPPWACAEELAMYPRESEFTPPWMEAAWPDAAPRSEAGPPPGCMSGTSGESDVTWAPLRDMVVRAVGRDDGSEMVSLGLAEYEDGTGVALIFMAAVEEPEMGSYCIVWEEQGGITYGGVSRCELGSGFLTLHFVERAAEELGVEPVLPIWLQVDGESVEVLKDSLREILLSGRHDQRPQSVEL